MNFIFDLLAQTTQPAMNGLEVLNGVDAFYNQAWAKLLWVLGIIGAILAVLVTGVPWWINRQQNKTFKKTDEALLGKIDGQRKELFGEIETQREKLMGEIEGQREVVEDQMEALEKTKSALKCFSLALAYHNEANLHKQGLIKSPETQEDFTNNIQCMLSIARCLNKATKKHSEAFRLDPVCFPGSFVSNSLAATDKFIKKADEFLQEYEKNGKFTGDMVEIISFKNEIASLERERKEKD